MSPVTYQILLGSASYESSNPTSCGTKPQFQIHPWREAVPQQDNETGHSTGSAFLPPVYQSCDH